MENTFQCNDSEGNKFYVEEKEKRSQMMEELCGLIKDAETGAHAPNKLNNLMDIKISKETQMQIYLNWLDKN